MRSWRKGLLFAKRAVACVVTAMLTSCVIQSPDLDDEASIGEGESALDSFTQVTDEPAAQAAGDEQSSNSEPNPTPWKPLVNEGGQAIASDGSEPNPTPWQPPGSSDPDTKSGTSSPSAGATDE